MGTLEVRITKDGTTVLPEEVRRLLGVSGGGTVRLVTTAEGEVRLIPLRSDIRHLRGLFGPSSSPLDTEAAISESVARRTSPEASGDDP